MADLLALTAELVDIPSESFEEAALADHVAAQLRTAGHLEVHRIGGNVVARTALDRPARVVVAGHLDTVPADGNAAARMEGDVLWGLGATDMKGGLAVMLALAESVTEPAVDVTWVFYVGEEVAAVHNGLAHLFAERPDLVRGDVAVLGEPTGGAIEAGCQGTMRMRIRLAGARAHTARPWKGDNAIHRAGRLLAAVGSYRERRPVIDGCEYREALQAVAVEGGVAGNVVPDQCVVTLNHRFAPDRTVEQARAHVESVLAPHVADRDEIQVVDVGGAAAPGLDHPLLAALRDRNGLLVRAKLGWTDVARFAAEGIPAANFGPGDPTLAHTPEERVERRTLETVHEALGRLLVRGAA